MKKILLGLSLLMITISASAQKNKDRQDSAKVKLKHFYYGFSFSNVWTDLRGLGQPTYFKPSLGAHAIFEYMFTDYIGISAGIGYQQRGAGLKLVNNDYYPNVNDSTYRLRLRQHSLDFPLALVLKTPRKWLPGFQFSLLLGAEPNWLFRGSTYMYYAIEDFNLTTLYTNRFRRFEAPLYAAIGLDIDAGPHAMLRVHAVTNQGFVGLYQRPGQTAYTGRTEMYGIRLTFMF
ncbi:MAG: porin family protein [Flavobacteriales bacterium]